MKKAVIAFIVGIAFVALLSSCSERPTLVTGKVEFNFDLSGARAVGYDITKVHIKLTHESGLVKETDLTVNESNDRAYGVIEGLRIGTWNVLAELYENETEVGSGSTNMVIEAGRMTNVTLRITLATGAASISVIWETTSGQGGEQKTEPDIIWQKTLGGSDGDLAYSIQQTSDGGYIVAGYTNSNDGDVSGNHGGYDYWIVKLDRNGNIQWQKTLGGSGDDEARSIQQTSDGGYIVAGWTFSNDGDVSGKHDSYDAWVVKLDSDGNIEWQKTLGGSINDRVYSIQQTLDGGYIVAGHTNSSDGDVSGNHGGDDYWIVKLDSDGNIVWQKTLGGSNNDVANSIQQTSDGGYVVAGYTSSNDGDVSGNHGNTDFWVVKLDSNGNIVWQKALGGSDSDVANSIQQTSDGGYIVAGHTTSNDGDVSGNHGFFDAWVVKLDSDGNIEWQKTLGGSGYDYTRAVQQTSDGGYIVAGYTGSNDGDVSGVHGNSDAWIVKLDSDGNIEWQKTLGGSGYDYTRAVQQTSDGGYIVAGNTSSNDGDVSGVHGSTDFWVVKLGW